MRMNSNLRIRKELTERHLKKISEDSDDVYVKVAVKNYLEDGSWFFAGIPESDIEDLRRAIEYNVKRFSEGIRFQSNEMLNTLAGEIVSDEIKVNYIGKSDLNSDEYIEINIKVGEGAESTRVKELMRSPDVIAFFKELTRPN